MDRDRKDITTCPCCGQRVSVYSGIEGTCSYVGEELAEGRRQGLIEASIIIQELVATHPISAAEAERLFLCRRFMEAIEAAAKEEE